MIFGGFGLWNCINNKYIQHDGIYTNLHNYKHVITFSVVLFVVFSCLLFIIAEQWHLRWQPWHTYLHNPNSLGISGGHSKTGIPGMYEMIPSYGSLGYQPFKKELVYWPVIHPPTKRFFTYAESRVWNDFRMGWQFVSRTIPCNCAIWMHRLHRCCKMSIGFISLPY